MDDIALEQLDRAKANGVHFAWITADSWYSAQAQTQLATLPVVNTQA